MLTDQVNENFTRMIETAYIICYIIMSKVRKTFYLNLIVKKFTFWNEVY